MANLVQPNGQREAEHDDEHPDDVVDDALHANSLNARTDYSLDAS